MAIPRPPRLLHIYDASDLVIALTASARRNTLWSRPNIYPIPINHGIPDLLLELDKLVNTRQEFSRALFETHGSSGSISFGKDRIDGRVWRIVFKNKGYESIFPYYHSRIYFNGCNVADNPHGWDFLDSAGSVFLKRTGGVAFAQTGVGRPIMFTGHVVHFGGSTAYSTWAPGGVFLGHSIG